MGLEGVEGFAQSLGLMSWRAFGLRLRRKGSGLRAVWMLFLL